MIIQLKKTLIVLFTMIITSYTYSQSYCNSNPVNVHGNLSVSGNKIVDQNNSAVSFAGNSLFWSNTNFGAEKYYNANVISWLKNDWNTTIVRAAMGVEDSGGYISDPIANKNRVIAVVDAAIAEGLYVIIDWHSHNAQNYQQQAIDFFKEMATLYGNSPNVIYEVYNEPIFVSWSNDVKPYAEAVISEIRAIDPDNLIIVGSPTWSQDVDVASNNPITSYTNIAYTLHFYAATHGASLRAKAQTALNNGIALMVTEWGTVSASGDGSVDSNSTDEWMDFLEANDISHLNWSVHDKLEGASILNSGASENGNWSDSDLTSSGLKVKSIVESWRTYCDGEPIVINPPNTDYTSIPAKIEAEDYTAQSGTQLENTQDSGGGENVGYIDINDSLSYNIEAPTSGDYIIDFRVASLENGASFDIFSGNTMIGNLSSNATGDWQAWETVSETVTLNQGEQTIKLVATGSGWNINWLEFSGSSNNNATFIPNPNKTYYIDSPIHNLRLAATGESEDAYTTNTNATGNDVEWKFIAKGNGYWHLQRAAGGTKPRLRTDNSANADMQETSSSGTFTYYEMTQGASNNTYFFTLPNGPANKRLQIDNTGAVKMVTASHSDTWESFSITETASNTARTILVRKSLEDDNNTVNVFQNSSTKNLNIYVNDINDYSNVIIFDIQGRKILSQKLNKNSSEISLMGYKHGIYFLKLSGKKNFLQTFINE